MPKQTDKGKDWSKVYTEEAGEAKEAPENASDAATAADAAAPEGETSAAATETSAGMGILEHPSYKALQGQLDKAEAQVHDNWEKAMRAMAEVDNVRRRLERDLENAHKYSIEKLIDELLPVADSLEQALAQTEENTTDPGALAEGMQLTLKLLLAAFEKFSLQQLDPVGEKFDPHLHEAMTMQDDSEAAVGTVLQVIQKGYKLHNRVVRPARVIVAGK